MKKSIVFASIVLVLLAMTSVVTAGYRQAPITAVPYLFPPTAYPAGMNPFAGSGPSLPLASRTAFVTQHYTVGPVVKATTSVPAAEEEIAVNPVTPSLMVAAISDFAIRGGYNTTKYTYSGNNGTSWVQAYVPYNPITQLLLTGDGNSWQANSDPSLAIDKLGNVFLSNLYFNASDNRGGLYVNIGVQNPVTGAVTFTAANTYAVVVNTSPTTTLFEDKPWIAVDNSSAVTSGNLYIAWSHFVGNSDYIVFSRSLDHGLTWSAPLRISPPIQDGAVEGTQVAVGPNGEVYLAYELFYVGNKCQQLLAKSTDGGQTFSTPIAITGLFNDLTFRSSYRKNSFPALAVIPTNGYVCALYSDQPNSTVGAQVEFIRSTNGGSTFSAPMAINDANAGHQFFPAIATDSSGRIHCSWFDTRLASFSTSFFNVYATLSVDGGSTFAMNSRVTPTSIYCDGTSFIGDYSGIAAGGGYAHPVWTSGGFYNGCLRTAALKAP